MQRKISRRELADAVGVSPTDVTRIFRRETGLTPWQYLNRYRVAQAQRLLRESDISVTEIAAQVGFNDAAYFSRIFRREERSTTCTFPQPDKLVPFCTREGAYLQQDACPNCRYP